MDGGHPSRTEEHMRSTDWVRIKHVDKPTTGITEGVQRIDMRDTAYGLAGRGDYGSVVQQAVLGV
jgi:hypothetical protein